MTRIRFAQAEFPEIETAVRAHLDRLPSRIDSFLEDHILESSHYLIEVGGRPAGFCSIHGGGLLTQFNLGGDFQARGQEAFTQLRATENANSAFVPTCDEFFLSHALDNYKSLAKQAYFFATGERARSIVANGCSLRLATVSDVELIVRESSDFFGQLEPYIERDEIYLTVRAGEVVGFGIASSSKLYERVASIGMFTIERYRQSGVGAATISLLIEECRRTGIEPIAGCWFGNHASKRTLERSGMYSATRLLRLEF